jgi:hypothetical protein
MHRLAAGFTHALLRLGFFQIHRGLRGIAEEVFVSRPTRALLA